MFATLAEIENKGDAQPAAIRLGRSRDHRQFCIFFETETNFRRATISEEELCSNAHLEALAKCESYRVRGQMVGLAARRKIVIYIDSTEAISIPAMLECNGSAGRRTCREIRRGLSENSIRFFPL